MSDQDPSTGTVETTEPDHVHICDACGDVWTHTEADCQYERWHTCPICVDDGQ